MPRFEKEWKEEEDRMGEDVDREWKRYSKKEKMREGGRERERGGGREVEITLRNWWQTVTIKNLLKRKPGKQTNLLLLLWWFCSTWSHLEMNQNQISCWANISYSHSVEIEGEGEDGERERGREKEGVRDRELEREIDRLLKAASTFATLTHILKAKHQSHLEHSNKKQGCL